MNAKFTPEGIYVNKDVNIGIAIGLGDQSRRAGDQARRQALDQGPRDRGRRADRQGAQGKARRRRSCRRNVHRQQQRRQRLLGSAPIINAGQAGIVTMETVVKTAGRARRRRDRDPAHDELVPLARSPRRRRLRRQRLPRRSQEAPGSDGPARSAVRLRTDHPLQIRKHFRFEAAHALPFHPGKCARMHGHSYRLEVAVRGPIRSRRAGSRHDRGFRRDRANRARDRDSTRSTIRLSTTSSRTRRPKTSCFGSGSASTAPCRGSTSSCCGRRRTACAVLRRSDLHGAPHDGTKERAGSSPKFFTAFKARDVDRHARRLRAPGRLQSRVRFLRHGLLDEVLRRASTTSSRRCARPAATVRWSILTGGEPLAQAETLALIDALRRDGRRVHVESNGTIFTELPADVWLCVSPKERVDPRMAARADEAKLIVDRRVPEEHLPLFAENRRSCCSRKGTSRRTSRSRSNTSKRIRSDFGFRCKRTSSLSVRR